MVGASRLMGARSGLSSSQTYSMVRLRLLVFKVALDKTTHEPRISAEMALATLQGAVMPGVNPPWTVSLSHSPNLESPEPRPYARLFPQFIKSATTPHPLLHGANPQTIFRWFRNAGPLVSVSMDVDVGHPERTTVIEYWDPEHANFARREKQAVHEDLSGSPAFTLRTFDPCNLYCAVGRSSHECVSI